MARKIVPGCAWALAWLTVLAATAAAGGPDAVGSLVGSRNATLDGHSPLPHTVLLSGDKVAVKDGLAMVTLDRGNRLILGRDSEAVFLREAGVLTVRMARGYLSLYHPPDGSRLCVKAGDVTVAPDGGPGTLGEISLADGFMAVTAKDGSMQLEEHGTTREVAKGHTIMVSTTAGGTPVRAPSGHSHLEQVLNHRTIVQLTTAAGAAGAGVSAIALARSSVQVSPVTPGP